MAFGKSIGLPGIWSVKKCTTTHIVNVNGTDHTIKITDKHWHGNFQGFNYQIDKNPQKFFCSRLTRDEVLESAKTKINS